MGNYKESIAIIIPALDPDERMVSLVGQLHDDGFSNIILVDDGSLIANRKYFKTCKETCHCKIIRHVVNFGKGIALKSAFNYILEQRPDIKGAVTVDCDGQHVLMDINTCAKLTYEHPDSLILGCRQFDDKEIPLRSRFGNKLTRQMIRLLCGIHVSDTQTGLRGLPTPLIREHFANVKGERFEYEMNMLIAAKEYQIPIEELFFKFMLSSLSSFIIDIALYWLLGYLLRPIISDKWMLPFFDLSVLILMRTVISRFASSLFNFFVNKNQVFKNDSSSPFLFVRYYTLAIVQLLLSAVLVDHLLTFITYSTLRKCVIDTLLFAISFQIQREWVFKK